METRPTSGESDGRTPTRGGGRAGSERETRDRGTQVDVRTTVRAQGLELRLGQKFPCSQESDRLEYQVRQLGDPERSSFTTEKISPKHFIHLRGGEVIGTKGKLEVSNLGRQHVLEVLDDFRSQWRVGDQ